ncbi:SCO2525 family SAM-dependent methyltransferase [Streptomyces sp. NBC_01198]|uniref:SCO2525 family SAM-dependent methyltransferase n=1 Tax=Streptomyces sp. NBC_01198 TaxID=2903769 RepID=UPI002E127774|nr:SCO2525 family SAM-dependent methyltransferase [Streptomyces sp. NBC_01198]
MTLWPAATPTPEDAEGHGARNADIDWNVFDPEAYVDHNYQSLRQDDAAIVGIMRDHFSQHCHDNPGAPLAGIDVGTGANLYPALALLPWCREVTLFERSQANIAWLRQQTPHYGTNWDNFWDLLCKAEPYAAISDPRLALRTAARVQPGDLFELPKKRWDVGTLFFVAEGMTTSYEEFREALRSFAECLVPGAPFAAAFMESSRGYTVGGASFPACSVGQDEVRAALGDYAEPDLRIDLVTFTDAPLRDGYSGMILACGRRKCAPETGRPVPGARKG